jgi:hypothetical protein
MMTYGLGHMPTDQEEVRLSPGWMAARMRWAEFRGPGPANRLQTAIFGDSAGICKTRIQQQTAAAAAEFGT